MPEKHAKPIVFHFLRQSCINKRLGQGRPGYCSGNSKASNGTSVSLGTNLSTTRIELLQLGFSVGERRNSVMEPQEGRQVRGGGQADTECSPLSWVQIYIYIFTVFEGKGREIPQLRKRRSVRLLQTWHLVRYLQNKPKGFWLIHCFIPGTSLHGETKREECKPRRDS